MTGRIRTLKPEVLTDGVTAQLTDAAWRTFVALILLADDYGNLHGDPRLIASSTFWGAPDVDREPIDVIMSVLESRGLVRRYEVRGQRYVHLCGWSKHQRVDKPGRPRVPAPPPADGATVGDTMVAFVRAAVSGLVRVVRCVDPVQALHRMALDAPGQTFELLAVGPDTPGLDDDLALDRVAGDWYRDCRAIRAKVRGMVANSRGGDRPLASARIERDDSGTLQQSCVRTVSRDGREGPAPDQGSGNRIREQEGEGICPAQAPAPVPASGQAGAQAHTHVAAPVPPAPDPERNEGAVGKLASTPQLTLLDQVVVPHPTEPEPAPGEPPARDADRMPAGALVRLRYEQRHVQVTGSPVGWSAKNVGHCDALGAWLDAKDGDPEALLQRLLDGFFRDDWARRTGYPLGALAGSPARYLQDPGRDPRRGFMAPAPASAFTPTDLDAVFGPYERTHPGAVHG